MKHFVHMFVIWFLVLVSTLVVGEISLLLLVIAFLVLIDQSYGTFIAKDLNDSMLFQLLDLKL